MKISFDGQTSPGNIITLTSVPNILTIESGTVQGSKSELLITVSNLASLDLTKEYTITVNDGLSSNIILRIVPHEDGYFIVTSNALCHIDNSGNIRKISILSFYGCWQTSHY